jgi:hypothetical protein
MFKQMNNVEFIKGWHLSKFSQLFSLETFDVTPEVSPIYRC